MYGTLRSRVDVGLGPAFRGALVPLGVMGDKGLREGAAGGHQEGPPGLQEGRRNTRLGAGLGH